MPSPFSCSNHTLCSQFARLVALHVSSTLILFLDLSDWLPRRRESLCFYPFFPFLISDYWCCFLYTRSRVVASLLAFSLCSLALLHLMTFRRIIIAKPAPSFCCRKLTVGSYLYLSRSRVSLDRCDTFPYRLETSIVLLYMISFCNFLALVCFFDRCGTLLID